MMLARRCLGKNVKSSSSSSCTKLRHHWSGSSSSLKLDTFHKNSNSNNNRNNNKNKHVIPSHVNSAGMRRNVMTSGLGGVNWNSSNYHSRYNNSNTMMMINNNNGHLLPSRCMMSTSADDGGEEGMLSSFYTEQIAEYIPSSKIIWGGSGWVLETLHMDGLVPYSLCFVGLNLIVRTALIPLVVKGARTAAHLATVAPEIQFLVTLFQRDFGQMRKQSRPLQEQIYLLRITWQTLRQIYKIHKVSPLDVFKSPLMQLPFFYYVSIDIRKIINGANPELAQKLTESPYLGYGMDLTEADPYYGLPILGGALLYLNVEMAMGKRSLSGETSSKSNIAKHLKDFFQSLAIFMPCFMSQSPAGLQIYLATSFVFTLGQGIALRNDDMRQMIGLPAMNAPRSQGKLATEFIQLKQQEQQAKEQRGKDEDDEVYGAQGVLAHGWETSFLGTKRTSTITTNFTDTTPTSTSTIPTAMDTATTITYNDHLTDTNNHQTISKDPISLSSPSWMKSQQPSLIVSPDAKPQPTPLLTLFPDDKDQAKVNNNINNESDSPKKNNEDQPLYNIMEQVSEDVMEAANRGERLEPEPIIVSPPATTISSSKQKTLNTKRFTKNSSTTKKKKNTKSKRRK